MYEKMYHVLAAAVSDAIDLIEGEEYEKALLLLERASREAEEIYISQ